MHDKDVMEAHLKNILYYHVAAHVYPAGKVLVSHTIPSMLKEGDLGGPDELQRIRVGLGLRGLYLNFYSRIVVADIFSSNGVIHGIDHILLPPPPARKAISLLPGQFSTLESLFIKLVLSKISQTLLQVLPSLLLRIEHLNVSVQESLLSSFPLMDENISNSLSSIILSPDKFYTLMRTLKATTRMTLRIFQKDDFILIWRL